MNLKRQDAWTKDEDVLLADVILSNIRNGGTQLKAFDEVAEKVGRTPSACGFRWNSIVRKQYDSAIKVAKAQRQNRTKSTYHDTMYNKDLETFDPTDNFLNNFQDRVSSNYSPDEYSDSLVSQEDPLHNIDNIIRFLRQHKNELGELQKEKNMLENQLQEKEYEISNLEKKNYEMRNQLSLVKSDYRLVNDDYKALVQIMERARKMAYMDGDSTKYQLGSEFEGVEN